MRFIISLFFLQVFLVASVNAYENITCANEAFCGKVVVEPEMEREKVCESGVLRVFSRGATSGVTCDCQCSLHEDISWFFDNEKNKIVSVGTGMLVERNYFEAQERFVFEAMGRTPLCGPYNGKNKPNANYLSLEKNQFNGAYCFDVFYVELDHGVNIYSPSGDLISRERVGEFSGESSLLKKILLEKKLPAPDSDSNERKRLAMKSDQAFSSQGDLTVSESKVNICNGKQCENLKVPINVDLELDGGFERRNIDDEPVKADVFFNGDWVVESVKVDRLSERSQKYVIDDPRLKGRIFKFSKDFIVRPNNINCSKPVYTERNKSVTALINQTFNANPAVYADIGMSLAKNSSIFYISCSPDGAADTVEERDWVFMLGPDKLLASSYGPTLLVLVRLESNKPPAPSFDCDKANGYIEKTICTSHELALFDKSLRQAYSAATMDSSESQKTYLKASQLNWIKA